MGDATKTQKRWTVVIFSRPRQSNINRTSTRAKPHIRLTLLSQISLLIRFLTINSMLLAIWAVHILHQYIDKHRPFAFQTNVIANVLLDAIKNWSDAPQYRAALALFYPSCLVRKFISLFIVAVKSYKLEYKNKLPKRGKSSNPITNN